MSTPLTNTAKKRVIQARRIENEDRLNILANKGVKDWLASIQDGAFKHMSKKQHRILAEDVEKLTSGKSDYVNRTRFDIIPFTDDIFEMKDHFNEVK